MCMRMLIFLEVIMVTAYFSRAERLLWGGSVAVIVLSFCLFDRENVLTLPASLIGVTSLIFSAKGNPLGQLLMVLFSLLYGVISYPFAYYGEMITYLGMTMPMSVFALISWLRNPYGGNRAEVRVNRIGRCETAGMCIAAVAVTAVFWHPFGHHQLPRRISHVPPKPVLCAGLRRQRCGAHRPVDSGQCGGRPVSVGGDLLCRVPDQRCIRFCQLAEDGEAAGPRLTGG